MQRWYVVCQVFECAAIEKLVTVDLSMGMSRRMHETQFRRAGRTRAAKIVALSLVYSSGRWHYVACFKVVMMVI